MLVIAAEIALRKRKKYGYIGQRMYVLKYPTIIINIHDYTVTHNTIDRLI